MSQIVSALNFKTFVLLYIALSETILPAYPIIERAGIKAE